MPQYEYKVIKCRVADQKFYTSWLSTYGWQVQNIQEFVDEVVNRSLGFSTNTGSGSMFGHAYYHPHTNNTAFSGYQTSHGWGSQSNTSVTTVKTRLSITFFRDLATPNRIELNSVENRWWNASERFMNKLLNANNTSGQRQWPEFHELERIDAEASAIRKRKLPVSTPPPPTSKSQEQKPKQAENKPIQVPNLPVTATISKIEVNHNVLHSGQPGIQICMAFSIQHRKGILCEMNGYFYDEHGHSLLDVNNKFRTVSGKVCIGTNFTPEFDDALFNDYLLFMPYVELDQPDGSRKLSFNVQIYDRITKSNPVISDTFHFFLTKNGSNIHGEAISQPIPAPSLVKKPVAPITKPSATKQPIVSKTALKPPKTKVAPLSQAERERSFIKAAGWTEMTEDRRLYMEGVFLRSDRKYSQAFKKFQKAINLNPKDGRYWSALAQELSVQGKIEQSLVILEKGLKELPGNTLLVASKGHQYAFMHDYAKAEEIAGQLEKSTEPGAKYNSLMIRALSAEFQGDCKKAIHFYDQADMLAEDPDKDPLKGLGQQRCRELMRQKK